jgi:topoisomerase (DNA) II binding protein 1
MSVPTYPMPSLQADEGDPFLEGYVFHYLVNQASEAPHMVGDVAKAILHHGGVICAQYDAGKVTHVVLETRGQPGTPDEQLYALARKDQKRVVSWTWVEGCIKVGGACTKVEVSCDPLVAFLRRLVSSTPGEPMK